MQNIIKFFCKYLVSFFKKTWTLNDYPLRYKIQKDVPAQFTWAVQIVNWWVMCGVGETKEKAYLNLKEQFENYKEILPRPGTKVPLRFAPTTKIEIMEDLAVDFFEKILDLNYYECFISDESNICEFPEDEDVVLEKIKNVYGIKLIDLGDGNISRLLEVINVNLNKN